MKSLFPGPSRNTNIVYLKQTPSRELPLTTRKTVFSHLNRVKMTEKWGWNPRENRHSSSYPRFYCKLQFQIRVALEQSLAKKNPMNCDLIQIISFKKFKITDIWNLIQFLRKQSLFVISIDPFITRQKIRLIFFSVRWPKATLYPKNAEVFDEVVCSCIPFKSTIMQNNKASYYVYC